VVFLQWRNIRKKLIKTSQIFQKLQWYKRATTQLKILLYRKENTLMLQSVPHTEMSLYVRLSSPLESVGKFPPPTPPFENHQEHTVNKLAGQNVRLLKVTASGIYNNHCAVKDYSAR